MTIVLTPYFSNGVQKLKIAPQRGYHSCLRVCNLANAHLASPQPARGLTPPSLEASVHQLRCLNQLRSKDKNIEKYIYLSQLKDADTSMFYKLCLDHMSVSVHPLRL